MEASTLAAFAGAYLWAVIPLAATMLGLLIVIRPAIGGARQRGFDLALGACLAVVALQVVPLPQWMRLALSPSAAAIDQALWLDAPVDPLAGPSRPLSIDTAATLWALAVAIAAAAAFWSAREIFGRSGIRTVASGIGWIGLALASVAMLQHTTAPELLYWRWPTLFRAAFTPYLNKNYFAAWLIMAIPVTAGYILARFQSRRRSGSSADLDAVVDAKTVWLGVSTCLMSAALLTTVSRSGLIGAAGGLASFMWLAHGRAGRRGLAPLAIVVLVALIVAVAYGNIGALADRFTGTLEASGNGRGVIWRETWPMVEDFWLTGVGAGAYERGMLVYWHQKGLWYVNHAHNEYLQLAAEGGVMLGLVVAVLLATGIRKVARALGRDTTPVFWLRVGAASGLVAIAVQSIWDTGLRMPANTILFALLAAIALHDTN